MHVANRFHALASEIPLPLSTAHERHRAAPGAGSRKNAEKEGGALGSLAVFVVFGTFQQALLQCLDLVPERPKHPKDAELGDPK